MTRLSQLLGLSTAVSLLLLGAPSASASGVLGIADLEVDGDTLSAEIRLGSLVLADLALELEESRNFDAGDLDLGVRLVGLTDAGVLSRLPGARRGLLGWVSSAVRIPVQLPLVLSIDPAPGSDLEMGGIWTLELHTHLLEYAPDTPLRLFKSHDGGPFEDVTQAMGSGSYRVKASGDCFSEFLIAIDLRRVDDVVELKLDRLENALDQHAGAITPAVLADLEARLATIRAEWNAGDELGAIFATEGFADAVEAAAGSGIPGGWSAATDDENAAGELRWRAGTLRFSLILAE